MHHATRQRKSSFIPILSGLGLGALGMYLYDPRAGRRRRAIAKDRLGKYWRETGDALDVAVRDTRGRVQGVMAEARRLFESREASDQVVMQRVRSKLGRVVSRPSAIDVKAVEGRVELSGAILEGEVAKTIAAVSSVPGVKEVQNQLDVHAEPGDIPALQGGSGRPGERFELLQSNWSPSARLFVGGTGSILTLYGLAAGGLLGATAAMTGAAGVLRSITNKDLSRLTGVGGGRRAVDIHKTININARVDVVYDFWTHFENFPGFMSNMQRVKDLGNGRSRWTVLGPAGVPIEFNSVITKIEPNQVLGWKSEPGSGLQNAGIVHFKSTGENSTQVDVTMSYNPPAGTIGHMVASIFGSHPKRLFDQDLQRMKTLLEEGKTTSRGREVGDRELEGQQQFGRH